MARRTKPIWIYKDKTVTKYESIKDAVGELGVAPSTITYFLKTKASRQGCKFYDHEPTDEELQATAMYQDRPRNNNVCKETIQNQEFEVDCKEREIFFLERRREGRVNQLGAFIRKNLEHRWMTIPKKQANLEKRFVEELLQSLK